MESDAIEANNPENNLFLVNSLDKKSCQQCESSQVGLSGPLAPHTHPKATTKNKISQRTAFQMQQEAESEPNSQQAYGKKKHWTKRSDEQAFPTETKEQFEEAREGYRGIQ